MSNNIIDDGDDFLTIGVEDAATAVEQNTIGGESKDKNLWKPSLTKDRHTYGAKIRLLPQGINGAKNKMAASVSFFMHYLKDEKLKVYKNVPCRKTLGEKTCPVCDAAWAIFNTGKETNNKELMDLAKSRLPKSRHIVNILVREDGVVPENNGKVLKWEHTDNVNQFLMAPLRDEEKKDDNVNKFKSRKNEKFNPYSPINGRDRIVVVDRNPKNNMPTYDNSYWDEDGLTNLADSKEEIMAILDQCHDLSEYKNVPSSEELFKMYEEFLSLVAAKQNTATNVGVGSSYTSQPNNTVAEKSRNVTQGNANDFFGSNQSTTESIEEDPFDMNTSSPTVENSSKSFDVNSIVEESSNNTEDVPFDDDISSEEDDDLPF